MERLKNIHIEKYGFTVHELPILALIKLYLNTTAEPEKAVEAALSSRDGLEKLMEKCKSFCENRREIF